MAAFTLLRRTDGDADARRRAALAAALAAQGFERPRHLSAAGCDIILYDSLLGAPAPLVALGPGELCLAVGTLFYRDQTGGTALRALHADFVPTAIPWADLRGQFCVLLATRRALHLFGDRGGLFKVYRDADLSVLSSSFLAVAATVPRHTIAPQGVYEYVFLGACFGTSTVLEEVALVDPDTRLCIADGAARAVALPPVPRPPRRSGPLAEVVAANTGALQAYFRPLAGAFGDRIATALSGGYDSRLILASLRAAGVAPYVYVYGGADAPDVRVARTIAAGEGFTLHHTDRLAAPPPAPETFAATVAATFQAFDGCPHGGIFDNGQDLATRRARAAGGRLVLNGMGGESYRSPELAVPRYRLEELVWGFYCDFDPTPATACFDPLAFCAALAGKLGTALGADGELLARADAEWLGPLFQARYWAGITVSLNNRFGPALLPFGDLGLTAEALRVEPCWRLFGVLQAALLRATDARLATYPGLDRPDFIGLPPQRIMRRELRRFLTPMTACRFVPAARTPRAAVLAPAYVDRVIDPAFPYLRHFFIPAQVTDGLEYNRLCTLEYLFERLAAREGKGDAKGAFRRPPLRNRP